MICAIPPPGAAITLLKPGALRKRIPGDHESNLGNYRCGEGSLTQ